MTLKDVILQEIADLEANAKSSEKAHEELCAGPCGDSWRQKGNATPGTLRAMQLWLVSLLDRECEHHDHLYKMVKSESSSEWSALTMKCDCGETIEAWLKD